MNRLAGTRLVGTRHARKLGSVHELPAELPEGEHVLWQGAPAWWAMARALHIRLIAGYFAVLLAWYAIDRLVSTPGGLLVSLARLGGLATSAVLLFAAFAWLVAHTSSYTLTSKRLVLQVGIALPISFNVPFERIATAELSEHRDGTGDIALRLVDGDRLGYAAIWPHARPWRLRQAEPMLRAVPNVARVARMLAHLLDATRDVRQDAARNVQDLRSRAVSPPDQAEGTSYQPMIVAA